MGNDDYTTGYAKGFLYCPNKDIGSNLSWFAGLCWADDYVQSSIAFVAVYE